MTAPWKAWWDEGTGWRGSSPCATCSPTWSPGVVSPWYHIWIARGWPCGPTGDRISPPPHCAAGGTLEDGNKSIRAGRLRRGRAAKGIVEILGLGGDVPRRIKLQLWWAKPPNHFDSESEAKLGRRLNVYLRWIKWRCMFKYQTLVLPNLVPQYGEVTIDSEWTKSTKPIWLEFRVSLVKKLEFSPTPAKRNTKATFLGGVEAVLRRHLLDLGAQLRPGQDGPVRVDLLDRVAEGHLLLVVGRVEQPSYNEREGWPPPRSVGEGRRRSRPRNRDGKIVSHRWRGGKSRCFWDGEFWRRRRRVFVFGRIRLLKWWVRGQRGCSTETGSRLIILFLLYYNLLLLLILWWYVKRHYCLNIKTNYNLIIPLR